MVFAGELGRQNSASQQKLRATRQRLIKPRRSLYGQQTVIFQKPACLFQLDRVSKTYLCTFISFSGNLRFRSFPQSMYFKRLVSFQMHTNRVFNGLRLIETSTQSLLHPEGGIPRIFGWGCAARYPKPLPYL